MANVWHAFASRVTYAVGKVMVDIYNGPSATRVVRILRIYNMNMPTYLTTTSSSTMELRRTRDAGGSLTGFQFQPQPQDKNNRDLEAALTVGSGRLVTNAADPSLLRQYRLFIGGPSTLQAPLLETYELVIPFNEVWNAGYTDAQVQPLVARAGQGYALVNTVGGASFTDFEIEFTDEDA